MNSILCDAIREKSKIQFCYEEQIRIVEPFCYGVNAKGNEVLRAFQTGGYSQSGNAYGWRLYNLMKISSVKILDESFDCRRPDYNPMDKQMVRIFCNV